MQGNNFSTIFLQIFGVLKKVATFAARLRKNG